MSPAMDLDHNGSLAWFFDEYVRHRAIAALSVSWTQAPRSGGGAQVAITIANPGHWRGLLPFYFLDSQSRPHRILLAVDGKEGRAELALPFTPVRIAADPWHEMLVHLATESRSSS